MRNCLALAQGDRRTGTVVEFPRRPAVQLSADTLASLVRFAARIPGAQPLSLGTDQRGADRVCFANGVAVGLDWRGRLFLTDTVSGFVDTGPFDGLDEVCEVLASVAA